MPEQQNETPKYNPVTIVLTSLTSILFIVCGLWFSEMTKSTDNLRLEIIEFRKDMKKIYEQNDNYVEQVSKIAAEEKKNSIAIENHEGRILTLEKKIK